MEEIKNSILEKIRAADMKNDPKSIYHFISKIIKESLKDKWNEDSRTNRKKAHYISMEFLIGRMIQNNLMNLGIFHKVQEILKNKGFDIGILEDIEDAALGSGGLGRLAACFLDSAASMNIPLNGYGIRYRYGLFKQSFEDGVQKETPDDWLKWGDPFSIYRDDIKIPVRYKKETVYAIAYDTPIIGYDLKRIGLLRLWEAKGSYAKVISHQLYPDDSTYEGRVQRLKQEYFLSAASVNDVVNNHVKEYGNNFTDFSYKNVFQLNDTHPVVSIIEFIRILIQEHGISFNQALEISKNSFAYTNHTIMSEALECWDIKMLKDILPFIYIIAKGINDHAGSDSHIIQNERLNMARLALFVCRNVNGVAKLHTKILKESLFSDFNELYPEKIRNITNGITQRRWLKLSNPLLSDFITQRIGEGWVTNLDELKKLESYNDKPSDIKIINEIKHLNKIRLADCINRSENVTIDAETLFDIQIKRLHEYKRQLMNGLSILYIYYGIKEGEIKEFQPVTYIFGAKAAPGYAMAKDIIRFINRIIGVINFDKETKDILRAVFVQNYNVSYAELLIPAADISEQISLAGTEASGTGNMKLMLNGAVTLGTLDGANIEIVKYAGRENNYIFGLTEDDVKKIKPSYDSILFLNENPNIKRLTNTLLLWGFDDIYNSLTKGNDRYMVLYDLKSYIEAKLKISDDYKDRISFGRKALFNIANAGYFSSDRAVIQYANEIWGMNI